MTRSSRSIPLTEGSIFHALLKLALPTIATSFVQMAYGLIDMIWVGRLGSGAVAAIGTSGFFTWLANAFILIPRIGAEVGVAQSVGRQDKEGVAKAIRHSIQLILALIVLCSRPVRTADPLLRFYRLGEEIQGMASTYLAIICVGSAVFCR